MEDYHTAAENIAAVVQDLDDTRLNRSFKQLLSAVEPLYDSHLFKLWDKTLSHTWLGKKHNEKDPCYQVPTDVFKYLLECDRTLRSIRVKLSLIGVEPSEKRLKELGMPKIHLKQSPTH